MRSVVSLAQLLDAGVIRSGTELRGRLKGRSFSARVQDDGSIEVRGQGVFKSPSLAGNAVTGRNTNGWDFWKLPDGRRLGDLRDLYKA